MSPALVQEVRDQWSIQVAQVVGMRMMTMKSSDGCCYCWIVIVVVVVHLMIIGVSDGTLMSAAVTLLGECGYVVRVPLRLWVVGSWKFV
jgi:hypothetical protein